MNAIDIYFSYRMDKQSSLVLCVMLIGKGENIKTLTLVDQDGHYVDGCLNLLTDWLTHKETEINQITGNLMLRLHFHRSALSLEKSFIRVKDAAMACRGLDLKQQKIVTKQKLCYANRTKPLSYISQVELVKVLVRLGKVLLTCKTSEDELVGRAYLLACGNLEEHKEHMVTVSNVIQLRAKAQD